MLDAHLVIQLWNRRAEDLWGLRPAEAVGRPFAELDIGLPVQTLIEPLRTYLAQSDDTHEQTVEAITRRGRAIRCRLTYTLCQQGGLVLLMEELG